MISVYVWRVSTETMAKHYRRYYWLSEIELDETIDGAHVCL